MTWPTVHPKKSLVLQCIPKLGQQAGPSFEAHDRVRFGDLQSFCQLLYGQSFQARTVDLAGLQRFTAEVACFEHLQACNS